MTAPFAAAFLLVLAASLAVGSMLGDSATADEGAHIASGLIKLIDGRVEFYSTQTPLIEVLEAIPPALAGYRPPQGWQRYGNRPWVIGHILLHRSGHDARRILTLARLPVVAMFLALAVAVFFFVRSVTASSVAALCALALTAFCPTLLAHGRLATVDMGLTLFAFLATVLLLRLLARPSAVLAVVTGVATAFVVTSKVSGAVIVPFFLLVVVLWWLKHGRIPVAHLALAAALSLGAFAAVYLLLARSLDLTLPFRAWFAAVRAVGQLYSDRYVLPQFLLGEFSHRGWPHYNFVAMAVKSTLPALAMLLLAFAVGIRRARFEAVVCALFAALFLAVSAFSSLNLGIRHVMPVYPFLYAGAAIVLFDAARAAAPRERRVFAVAAAVLAAGHVVVAIMAWPSYLSYFNPLIGSHRNADAILIDSNLDWGQDLGRLERWARAEGIEKIRVHYFGAGSVEQELGSRGERWPAPRRELLPKGWFAVSRHFYRLSFDPSRSPVSYDRYLQASKARFVTSIGGSIDVYRVE